MTGRSLPSLGSLTGGESTRATPTERSARRPVRRVPRLPMAARPGLEDRAPYRTTPFSPAARHKIVAAPAARTVSTGVGTLNPRQGVMKSARAGGRGDR